MSHLDPLDANLTFDWGTIERDAGRATFDAISFLFNKLQQLSLEDRGGFEGVGSVTGIEDIQHLDISYGTGELGDKDTAISALGATDVSDVLLVFNGPHIIIDSTGYQYAIGCWLKDASTATFNKTVIAGTGTGEPSTHRFWVAKVRRP